MRRPALLLIVTAGASAPAYAYLDPGVAYAAPQPLLVVIAGAFAAVVGYKDRLCGWLGIKRGSGEEDGEITTTEYETPITMHDDR